MVAMETDSTVVAAPKRTYHTGRIRQERLKTSKVKREGGEGGRKKRWEGSRSRDMVKEMLGKLLQLGQGVEAGREC